MILIIDNFDSFVYNLFQMFKTLTEDVIVRRRNNLTLQEVKSLAPHYIVISPGPGKPEEAAECIEIIRYFTGKIPILGVCLGHQCIAQAFGGHVVPAGKVMHGLTSEIYHDEQSIFYDIPNPFEATRYHSLIVSEENLPEEIEVSAYTAEGEIMGIRLKGTATEGVQFHPESFLTREGIKIIKNFLELGSQK
jgi:para-aminobenzoate synthetase component 2